MIDAKTLSNIHRNGLTAFSEGRILDGIAALKGLTPYCAAEVGISAEAASLEDSYRCMLTFLRSGGSDQQRSQVQNKIERQGIQLLQKASRLIRLTQDDGHYSQAHTRLLELYSEAMQDELTAKWGRLLTPEERSDTQDDLFDLLWTSPVWTSRDTALWYDFILQQDNMVQQHLCGAVFLSAMEYLDCEKMQLLSLMTDSECRRTRITAAAYLLILHLTHKELIPFMPDLPDRLTGSSGNALIAEVQQEMLTMLLSEADMRQEFEELEALSKDLFKGGNVNLDNIRKVVELKGRHLRRCIEKGLDPNLGKASLLHSCKYMHRIAHWFLPFDKNHPLFQSVMIDEKGQEKRSFSVLVDHIMDCDVDKLALFYLVSTDDDYAKAIRQLEQQELPEDLSPGAPEYSIKHLMQDLYRFFLHSRLSKQIFNPFTCQQTLLDIPSTAQCFTSEAGIANAMLMVELGRHQQAVALVDNLIARDGASVVLLTIKGQALILMEEYTQAAACLRSAEILNPDDPDILKLLTQCYAAQGRFEEELEYLLRLSELQPDSKSLQRLIPLTMVKAGHYEEALQRFFRQDYEAESDNAETLMWIAATALQLDKLDIALRYTEKELELADKEAAQPAEDAARRGARSVRKWRSYLRLGHIRLIQGDWKGALEAYGQSASLFPEESGEEAKAFIAKFDAERDLLSAKGIAVGDIMLVRDILLSMF